MTTFMEKRLPLVPDAIAPDSSAVQVLLSLKGGGLAHFQFRAFGPEPLQAIGVTMPPWPGPGEAFLVEGRWEATVKPGNG